MTSSVVLAAATTAAGGGGADVIPGDVGNRSLRLLVTFFITTFLAINSASSIPAVVSPASHTASVSGVTSSTSSVREYCEWESFNASCGGVGDDDVTESDHVIVVRSARYGRMHVGRCVTQSYGNIGCSADVTSDLARSCSGRVRCSVGVISLYGRRSCPKDFTSYLEAGYECVPLSRSATDDACSNNDVNKLLLTSPTGQLASRLSPTSCPWTIRVEPFQQIIVSLTDFESPSSVGQLVSKPGPSTADCIEYAVIGDVSSSSVLDGDQSTQVSNTSLCGGASVGVATATGLRDEVVYRSRGHVIQIYIKPHRSFLISYEAVGCPEVPAPPNTWTRRSGTQHAVVQCNSSTEAWFLTCRGTNWIGTVGNCSTMYRHSSGGADDDWPVFNDSQRFPIGVLVVVALGVAIGVVVGVLMLVAVLTCMRRRRRTHKVQSRSNCDAITSGYVVASDPCFGDVPKIVDRSMAGEHLVYTHDVTASVQSELVSDAADVGLTSSVVLSTSAGRDDEGLTEAAATDAERAKDHPRRSRSSSCLVSMVSPTSDCLTVNATTSARVHPQAPPSCATRRVSSSVGTASVHIRDECRTSGRQPQYFILADPSKHNATSSNVVDYAIGVRPTVKWMTSGRRRCLSSDRNIERCEWDATTPVHPLRLKQPSVNLRRSKLRATSTDIPHVWNNTTNCQRQYEPYYKPPIATVHGIYQTMDRNPDVLKNCAICQHASGNLGHGTMKISTSAAMAAAAAGDNERNAIYSGNERF